MQFPRNGDHPVVWIRWHCDAAVECGSIAVIVVECDRTRTLTLHHIARDVGGVFVTCQATRSAKQFVRLVSGSLGITTSPCRYDKAFQEVTNALKAAKTPLFLDRADLLTRASLQIVLDIVKLCQTGCILSSGSRKLLERIEGADDSGSFMSYCSFYCPNVRATPKLRELRNAARTYGAPPTLKFPKQ